MRDRPGMEELSHSHCRVGGGWVADPSPASRCDWPARRTRGQLRAAGLADSRTRLAPGPRRRRPPGTRCPAAWGQLHPCASPLPPPRLPPLSPSLVNRSDSAAVSASHACRWRRRPPARSRLCRSRGATGQGLRSPSPVGRNLPVLTSSHGATHPVPQGWGWKALL